MWEVNLYAYDPGPGGIPGLFTAGQEEVEILLKSTGMDPSTIRLINVSEEVLESLIDSFDIDQRIDYKACSVTLLGFNPVEYFVE